MKKYTIQDRKAGNLIERGLTYKKAVQILTQFEKEDKKDGIYTPDFYEIVEG